MSGAYSLFQEIKTRGMEFINQLVEVQEQESLILDFKRATSNTAPMEDGDRKTLAKAISGFSNADGGVLIWGVDCRQGRGKSDPDVVQGLKPIANLRRWLSDLNSYTSQHVSPPVEGIEHHIIFSDENAETDSGFAMTYIPKSDGLPTMTTFEHVYYTRIGASFKKMEAFMIADRYQRRPQPKLELFWEYDSRLDGDRRNYNITFHLFLKNVGRGIAQFPALEVYDNDTLQYDELAARLTHGVGLYRKPLSSLKGSNFFQGDANTVIYPGQYLRVVTLTGNIHKSIVFNEPRDITIEYKIFSDGFYKSGQIVVNEARISLDHLKD